MQNNKFFKNYIQLSLHKTYNTAHTSYKEIMQKQDIIFSLRKRWNVLFLLTDSNLQLNIVTINNTC